MKRKNPIRFHILLFALVVFVCSMPLSIHAAPDTNKELSIRPYITISKGGTYQLTPTLDRVFANCNNLYFQSQNASVAKVDPTGLITALKKGSTKITISLKENPTIQCSIRVYVGRRATKLKLKYTKKTIQVDNYFMLKANIHSRRTTLKKLSYKSSNPSIVQVSSKGKVTGKKPGTATITVSTMDGSNLSKSCVVTVVSKEEDTEDNFFFFQEEQPKEKTP